MKNVRFRAVSSSEHLLIFGDGIIGVDDKIYLIQAEISSQIEVIPDTIEQLICYDDNGKEIFENDFVQDAEKNIYKAVLLQSFERNNFYIPVWQIKNISLR